MKRSLPVPVRAAVERMRPYHPPLEGRDDKIRLDFNENTAGCSPRVLRALAKLAAADLSMYPEQESVRREMAKSFRVRADELLLSNGTDEALHLIANAFLDAGDSVLLVEPTFAMYRFYAELAGAGVQALRYDQNLEFPMRDVLRALRSAPRVFFLANPNNPTGGVLKKPELRKILAAAPRTMFVVDEAYFEYSGITIVPWVRRHCNLIVTRTFSKAAGLAGLRLGCLFAHREITPLLRKAQSPYPISIPALVAGKAALRDRAQLARTLREFRLSRAALEHGLARLGIRYFPSAANFILMDLGAKAKGVVASLAKKRILIRDRSSDFGGRGYVRITIGTLDETHRVLRGLEKLL
ncbi:MAG TPA: histidinol-phosphate transaminase [Candidatus Acidoferrales bacterium]|jgi:histidinol-phosphate aminotransferase